MRYGFDFKIRNCIDNCFKVTIRYPLNHKFLEGKNYKIYKAQNNKSYTEELYFIETFGKFKVYV